MKNIKETEIGSLVQDNLNFNRGTEFGERLMDNSLRKFGLGRSVLVDKNNRIIAGNKTVEKAVELGFEKAIVVETSGEQLVVVKRKDIDLDSEMGREMALADNATSAANLEWDEETIQQAQAEFGLDIDSWGVNISETDDAGQEQEKAAEEDDYELNDDVKTSIKEGDMFEFRKGDICHRLICGDSTKQETMTKLMGERKADLWLTAPPYNVNYQGGTKDKLKIANDNMDNAAFVAFLIDAFKTAVNSVKLGGGILYLACRLYGVGVPIRSPRCRAHAERDTHMGQELARPRQAGLPVAARAMPLRMEGRSSALLHQRPHADYSV